eukprot:1935427-Alexandrium_andersonii.AAC.1
MESAARAGAKVERLPDRGLRQQAVAAQILPRGSSGAEHTPAAVRQVRSLRDAAARAVFRPAPGRPAELALEVAAAIGQDIDPRAYVLAKRLVALRRAWAWGASLGPLLDFLFWANGISVEERCGRRRGCRGGR